MTDVISVESILGESKKENEKKSLSEKKKKTLLPPRGKPKSGRTWKKEKQRFKSIIKTRGIQKANSFEKQMKLKEDLKRVKTISRAREQERLEILERKKERRRQNLEKQKQNELKSEVVQVIKNSAKIKKMRRKQLRSIEKRDTTKISKT